MNANTINRAMKRTIKCGVAALAVAMAGQAAAQSYPNKGILMVVPLATASATDVVMRIVTQKMGENMGQQFAIENIPGAAGMLGGVPRPTATPSAASAMRWSMACLCCIRTCPMIRSPVSHRSASRLG